MISRPRFTPAYIPRQAICRRAIVHVDERDRRGSKVLPVDFHCGRAIHDLKNRTLSPVFERFIESAPDAATPSLTSKARRTIIEAECPLRVDVC